MKRYLELLSFHKTTNHLLGIILVTFLLFPLNLIYGQLFSQVPTLEWERRYHGNGNSQNIPIKLAVDSSGNSYVTGVASILDENQNIVTIKYNSAGVQQWLDLYNGPPGSNSIDWPVTIKIDKLRNVYVCGYSESAGFGSNDYLTIKYSPNGTRLWAARYNSAGTFSDKANDMTLDDSGNVYITGQSYNGIRIDAVTIKYNSNGDSVWVRRYNPATSTAIGNSVVVDNIGNVFVSVQYNFALYLVKYNSAGVFQWVMPGASVANFKSVIDNSGNIFIGGTINQGIPITADFYVCKYASSGTLLWAKTYNGTANNNDDIEDLYCSNSNIYVTGYSGGLGSQGDYVTINYNTNGDSLWVRRFNGDLNGNDDPRAITSDVLGNVYVTGLCASSSGEMVSIKYNASGVLQWELHYSGGGKDIKVDPVSNKLFVLGFTLDSIPDGDIINIKYDQLVGISNISTNTPGNCILLQNFPNPFNPVTKINYQLINKSFVTLKIYSVLGLEINTLVNQEQRPGYYEINWNAANYPSGVYFYKIITKDYSETKKMILIK